jgi:hypothetical protein
MLKKLAVPFFSLTVALATFGCSSRSSSSGTGGAGGGATGGSAGGSAGGATGGSAGGAAGGAELCTLDSGSTGTLCSGTCVNTQTDPMNCGGCGIGIGGAPVSVSCDAGSICAKGNCQNVVGSLEGLRWSLPCTDVPSGNNCSATNPAPQMTTVQGTAGVTYNVSLRFRGVVEEKTYSGVPDSGAGLAVGTNASFFVVGGTPGGDGYNIYTLTIQGPDANTLPLNAYLNSGASGLSPCWPIDYTVKLPMEAGSTISLTASTVDGQERANEDSNGNPILIPGIPPYPSAYDGQFVQMDVVSVVPAP